MTSLRFRISAPPLALALALFSIHFSNAAAATLVSYNEFTLGYTFQSATTLTGGPFAGYEVNTVVQKPYFFGVEDGEFRLLRESDNTAYQYNLLTATLVAATLVQPLTGGAFAGQKLLSGAAKNPNYLDTSDDGFVMVKPNGAPTYYSVLGANLFDTTWTQFSGGPLAGQSPNRSNVRAVEDGLLYYLESNGTLGAYSYFTGALFTDLWTTTTFTGGPLGGKFISDALTGNLPNVKFVGIAADQLVFANDLAPVPEPGGVWPFGTGLLLVLCGLKRKVPVAAAPPSADSLRCI